MNYLTVIYLGISAWTDWKSKEVDCRHAAVFAVCVSLWKAVFHEPFYWTGILPGICLWALSFWKKSGIGNGDGIVAVVLGWALGIEKIWNIIVGGFFLAGTAGVFLWIRRKNRKEEIPFVPFLLGGFLLEQISTW